MKRIYKNWFVHNAIGHPLMAIFQIFRANKLAKAIHDSTLPEDLY